MIISPSIRSSLTRDDLHRLIAEVGTADRDQAYHFAELVSEGDIDSVLDAPITLDIIRGIGGAPAPLPLQLLWYVPVRAALKSAGFVSRTLADLTASVPVAFYSSRQSKQMGGRDVGLAAWNRFISSMPRGTVARGEAAANCAAHALWLSGIFPEWVSRKNQGPGAIRAYIDFAAGAFGVAATSLRRVSPDSAALFKRASSAAHSMHTALRSTAVDYIGRNAHKPELRLERFLDRLKGDGGNSLLQ